MAKNILGWGSVITGVRGRVVSGVHVQIDLILILIGTYAYVINIVCLGLGLL